MYFQSTKEFREPHEIFGTEAPTKDAHEDKAESTDGRNPLRKRSLGGSNDSDDDNASLMSVGQAITELEEDYLSRKKEKEVHIICMNMRILLFYFLCRCRNEMPRDS